MIESKLDMLQPEKPLKQLLKLSKIFFDVISTYSFQISASMAPQKMIFHQKIFKVENYITNAWVTIFCNETDAI